MTTQHTLSKMSKDELLTLSYDFIAFNRDFTNEDIPDFLLKFWSMSSYTKSLEPNEIAVLIFSYIFNLDLKAKGQIEIKDVFGTYRFFCLFHVFQIVLKFTIYSRKYKIALEPFQIFRIEKYNVEQLEEPGQLITEYLKFVTPIEWRQKRRMPPKSHLSEISIPSKLSNIILIEGLINKRLDNGFLSRSVLERIYSATIAAVKHAIVYVNESEVEKSINVSISTSAFFVRITILCGVKNDRPQKCTFRPQKPTDDDDFKGQYLYTIRELTDKRSFFDDGAEVRLIFNI